MKRQPAMPYAGPTTLGIDVSKWQGSVSWGRVAQDTPTIDGIEQGRVRFAVCRSGDGKDADRTCVRHLEEARAAGLLVGVYHYLRAVHSGVMQADMALEALRMAGVRTAIVAVDVEGHPRLRGHHPDGAWWTDDAQGVSTERVLRCAEAFVSAIQAAGFRCLMYTGVAWHWHISQPGLTPDWAKRLDLWTPYYTKTGRVPRLPADRHGSLTWPEWRIWQYAGTPQNAQVHGIAGPVDLNRFRGDESELARYWTPLERDTQPGFDRADIARMGQRAKDAGDLAAAVGLVELHDRLRGKAS